MAKRLTEKQKKEIKECFKNGISIDSISKDFNCTKLTIVRNLKVSLGEENYKKYQIINKKSIEKNITNENKSQQKLDFNKNEEGLNERSYESLNPTEIRNAEDF